jgi:hypothetical protein
MSPAKKEISLLPDDANVNTIGARAMRWVTTVARFVIIITEMIIIGAFLSRFYLDRKNSDLSDVIRQQKAIIESTQNFENDFVLLQKKLSIISQYYKNQPEYQTKIATLIESTPPNITYDNLQLNSESQNVTALISFNAFDETSIIDLITNLILNPKIKSVDVNTIEKKPKDTKYIVNLTVTFKSNVTN